MTCRLASHRRARYPSPVLPGFWPSCGQIDRVPVADGIAARLQVPASRLILRQITGAVRGYRGSPVTDTGTGRVQIGSPHTRLRRACCGFPKFPAVDHWNSPGDERCGGPGMSLRGCQAGASCPVSSAMVTGSSQEGQQPPVPARRMKVPHWSQRWFPTARLPQLPHS